MSEAAAVLSFVQMRAAQFTRFDDFDEVASSTGTADCGYTLDDFSGDEGEVDFDCHAVSPRSTECAKSLAYGGIDKLLGGVGYSGGVGREVFCHVVADPAITMGSVGLPVCAVPGQSKYEGGGLMCSTCASILGLSVSAGLMPDPGSIPESVCSALLIMVMQKSSAIQQEWIRQVSKTGGNEMRQIAEVVALITSSDELGSFSKAGQRVECFGPLSHAGSCTVSLCPPPPPLPFCRPMHEPL